MEVIDELCSFQGRRAGTDAERRAANWLAKRVRDGGRRVVVEPIYVHPQYGLVQALHCALGFAGSLVAILAPPVGFAMVLVAALSMYLDLNGRFYLARRLFKLLEAPPAGHCDTRERRRSSTTRSTAGRSSAVTAKRDLS